MNNPLTLYEQRIFALVGKKGLGRGELLFAIFKHALSLLRADSVDLFSGKPFKVFHLFFTLISVSGVLDSGPGVSPRRGGGVFFARAWGGGF